MPDWRREAAAAAKRHGLDPNIFIRQINQESGGRDVRSPAGAQGPAQFMPGTARSVGLTPASVHQLGPSLNAAAGLMSKYVKQYGSYKNALVAYNAGPGRVGGALPAETQNYVKTILGGSDPKRLATPSASPSSRGGGRTSTSTTTTTPGVDNSAARYQLVRSFLDSKSADPVSFATQFKGLADVAPTSNTVTSRSGGVTSATSPSIGGGGLAGSAQQRANVINAQALPYKWGGGHAGQTKLTDAVPLDCSGAVSKVLGIDPRVASDFKTWGRPGDGGNKGVTIAASDEHVLMKIRGHWFGTSRSNPQGGAGWIPEEQITPGYLASFTLRHSAR